MKMIKQPFLCLHLPNKWYICINYFPEHEAFTSPGIK